MNIVVCLVTCPNHEVGTALARRLVEDRLAACVNQIPGIQSVYRWKDEVCIDQEELLVIKTAGDPTALASAVRETVRSADPEQPVFDVKTMQQRMDEVAQSRKAPMVLLSLFSGVALLLAVLGVYGVLAFSVTQRTSEFGVRIALGASPGDIATLVLRQGARLVAIGIGAGLVAYLALSSIVGKLLYGVAATDPATLALAPIVLALAAMAACLLPVRKAVRVNPLEALRTE